MPLRQVSSLTDQCYLITTNLRYLDVPSVRRSLDHNTQAQVPAFRGSGDRRKAAFEAAEPSARTVGAVHDPHRVVDAVPGAAVGAKLEVDEVESNLVE